jgi:ATP/maltotriose-dependent transcriptional regulator MalT
MTVAAVSRARELHALARWDDACVEFLAATAERELDVEDLERLAEAAQLTGRHDTAAAALERAFTLRASVADLPAAATAAFWLYSEFLYAGEHARASGWMSRLRELSEQLAVDEESGWLSIAAAHRCIGQRRYDDARAVLTGAVAQGRGSGDVDLETFAILLTARSLLLGGLLDEGLARMDDAMLRVTSGQTSPRMTSMLFCAAIGTCEEEAWEHARAHEWARALERWMASLPTLFGGAFLENCRVYRAALKRQRGQLAEARAELEQAAHNLSEGHGALVAGHACYELGEVHRLLGEDTAADAAYRRATSLGASVHPGLALMRLRQGDIAGAARGLRRALAETARAPERGRLLPALVTVSLAAGVPEEAQAALEELEQLAGAMGGSALEAEVARSRGEIALAVGRPDAALPDLRRSADAWRQLATPYDTASTSVLIAHACRALGDEEGARLELASARETFAQLGARPDLQVVDALMEPSPPDHGLGRRELQVLELVAAGMTNRAIASQLHLSERTVHRHVSNIFDKLSVRSRTAAATFAIEHRLVRSPEGRNLRR